MILFKKEKEVIDLIEKHADKMEECLSTSIKTIQAYLKENIDEALGVLDRCISEEEKDMGL